MANGVHDLPLDHLIGKQSQCPASVTVRRIPQPHSDELRFLVSIQPVGCGRLFSLLAMESSFESLEDEFLADVLNGFRSAIKRLCDPGVCPIGSVGISFEQDLGSSDLL